MADGIRTHDLLHGNYAGFERLPCENLPLCRGSPDGATGARHRRCAWMHADMRRFGNSWPEVPEIGEGGFNRSRAGEA